MTRACCLHNTQRMHSFSMSLSKMHQRKRIVVYLKLFQNHCKIKYSTICIQLIINNLVFLFLSPKNHSRYKKWLKSTCLYYCKILEHLYEKGGIMIYTIIIIISNRLIDMSHLLLPNWVTYRTSISMFLC